MIVDSDGFEDSQRTMQKFMDLIWVKKNEIESNIICDSCLDDVITVENLNSDALMICDNCNVAVH